MRTLNYHRLRDRAAAYRESVWNRAQALCLAAGLDAAGTVHNAMVGLARGEPWPRVDYAKAAEAHRLFTDGQWRAHRVVDRLYYANPRRFSFEREVA